MEPRDDPASVHRRFVDQVVVGKRVELVGELFSPDADLEQGSVDALRAQMEAQAVAFDVELAYVNEVVQDDWVVHRMEISMIMTGPFMGMAPTNATAKFYEVEAARVVEGKIVEMWSEVDRSDVFRQLEIQGPTAD